ncbi:MAG: glycosyltransferase family 39 protein, partial [Myxococcales bacterium]
DHPPLGKLLIVTGISALGDNSVGFRLPALIAGLLTIGLGAGAAHRLFRAKWSASLAAALLAADGFLIAYSRAALLDGFLVMASLAALLLVGFEVSLTWGCIAGAILGFAASVKFSGIGVLLPLLFAVAISKQRSKQKLTALTGMGLVAAFVYVSTYGIGLNITGKPSGVLDVFADTQRLLKHHSDLTDMKNPATSGWSTWFLPKRPLLLGIYEKHGAVRALTTLGNLATWWSSVALAVASLVVVSRLGWGRVLKLGESIASDGEDTSTAQTTVTRFVIGNGPAVIAVLLGAIGFLAPWILTHRDSYIYHFLPAYAPLVVLLSGFLGWYEQQQPNRVFYFAVLVLLVAAFYAPLWGYMPISSDALSLRLFLNSWH